MSVEQLTDHRSWAVLHRPEQPAGQEPGALVHLIELDARSTREATADATLPVVAPESGAAPSLTAVIVARDEERGIARCVRSLTGAVDRILLVDTGSTDDTVGQARASAQAPLDVIHLPWPDDFGAVRNAALDAVAVGWVLFVDADEWLAVPGNTHFRELAALIDSSPEPGSFVLGPTIVDDEGYRSRGVMRMLRADGDVRYVGAVHEEPRHRELGVAGLRWGILDIEIGHDGYRPDVVEAKDKMSRNAALIKKCLRAEPDNPRWLYFAVRDGADGIEPAELAAQCRRLRKLAEARRPVPNAEGYYCGALRAAARSLFTRGHLPEAMTLADELDRLRPGNSDGLYYRQAVAMVRRRQESEEALKALVQHRRSGPAVEDDALHTGGAHLDALITALLCETGRWRQAERYHRSLEQTWTDVLFDGSLPNWLTFDEGSR